MSKRTSIVKALADKFKEIEGQDPYKTHLYGNSFAKLRFWDEIQDFPSVFVTPGTEQREYHPSDFAWVYLNVSIKVYCKGDTAQEQLEALLEDLETCIDANRTLVYDSDRNYSTAEILVQSITTDEGLLAPFAIGELNIRIQYQKE